MKITPETKIKDLIPEGYEICEKSYWNYSYKMSDITEISHIEIWLKPKKQKTLEDYEEEFQGRDYEFATKLKDFYPKLYYSQILQMIADDICEEEQDRIWWLNNYELTCRNANYGDYPLGAVFFDTEEHALQAEKIMGDKLKLLL